MLEPVYFDARFIRVGHHDGISRFSAGLCSALVEKTKVIAIIHDERQLDKLPKAIEYVKLSDPTKPLKELLIALRLNRLGAKIVFSPMQTMGTWFRKYKVVLTLHDLIYYSHPAPPPTFSWPIRLGWRLFHLTYTPQRLMLNGADAVATVSQTTKRLIGKYKLTRKPVFVVYNAGSGAKPIGLDRQKDSLVYMGSYMDYKNVECLIAALALLPTYKLHLLSRIDDRRKAELTHLAAKNADRVIFHNGVTDLEYRKILGQAFALVTASKEEGFGIPVIEAMELGTPAVISDIEIFREIGGSAARYFDAAEPGQLVQRIRELEDDEFWTQTSKSAMRQAEKFNWQASAQSLLNVLRDL